ncbi:hypothetical protein M422DRAFT_158947, partial [Sphaerobolus stellatus SS14]
HFGKRCISFSQNSTSPVTVHFKDDTSADCDILVGCDGIRSAVRDELLRPGPGHGTSCDDRANGVKRGFSGLRFSGTVAYRILLKAEDLEAADAGSHPAKTGQKMYCGKDKHIVTYPVGGGRLINVIAYCSIPEKYKEWENGPWVLEVGQSDILDQYQDFEPEAQELLKCVKGASRWAMYEINPLPLWSKGRVCLLGDAAHAMSPFIAAGGGQVIEDAYILSRLLGSPSVTRESAAAALFAYEKVRKPRATRVLYCTREAKKVYESQENYEQADGATILEALSEAVEWLWDGKGDIDDDVAEALKFMDEK